MIKAPMLKLLIIVSTVCYSQYYHQGEPLEVFRNPLSGFLSVIMRDGLSSINNLSPAFNDRLNLYDFGENPAWITMEERNNGVWVGFYGSTIFGGYRRIYDPARLNYYNINFVRVENLGKKGVFKGYALYNFEERKGLYRSLLLYPYDGKAFFVTDTTVGNFRYLGPNIGFDYGFELVKNFFTGLRLRYTLIDGLKDIYTRPRTIYRDIECVIGLAFKVMERTSFGFSAVLINSREKIEAKSEDLYDVEIYFFRGDQYFVKRRANLVEFNLKDRGYAGYTQLNFSVGKAAFGFNIGYKQIGKYLVVPYGFIEEYEFGYANFESYMGKFMGRLKASDFLNIALLIRYEHDDIWSKHSERNLLLWREKFDFMEYGSGVSFRGFKMFPKIAFEFMIRTSKSDSMKYIDNRFTKLKSVDYSLGGALEYALDKNFILGVGMRYQSFTKDIVTGCDNVKYYEIAGGFEVFQRLRFIFRFARFKNRSVNLLQNEVKNDFSCLIIAKLN